MCGVIIRALDLSLVRLFVCSISAVGAQNQEELVGCLSIGKEERVGGRKKRECRLHEARREGGRRGEEKQKEEQEIQHQGRQEERERKNRADQAGSET